MSTLVAPRRRVRPPQAYPRWGPVICTNIVEVHTVWARLNQEQKDVVLQKIVTACCALIHPKVNKKIEEDPCNEDR